jgi:uncharacterized damage-inducible protein DinB
MARSVLQDGFDHHVWATMRLLDTCEGLDPTQLATEVPGIYGSILDTIRHIVGADAWYLFVITEGRVANIDEDRMDLPALRRSMEVFGREWTDLLAGAVDADEIKVAHHSDGGQTSAPMGIRLAQVLHHGTDHRSQICTALTALGIEPPAIDVWAFGEEQGSVIEIR